MIEQSQKVNILLAIATFPQLVAGISVMSSLKAQQVCYFCYIGCRVYTSCHNQLCHDMISCH